MMTQERFFTFGVDLELHEAERPPDLDDRWTSEPFVEQNLETVLASNLRVLLPEEELLLVGRQLPIWKVVDLIAINKAGDVVLFEIKNKAIEPDDVAQGLDYVMDCFALDRLEYVNRYLAAHRNRHYAEAVRILGLVLGKELHKGQVEPTKYEKELDGWSQTAGSRLSSADYLNLGRALLNRIGAVSFETTTEPENVLNEAYSRAFGFDGSEILDSCLASSVNIAFVGPSFSAEALKVIDSYHQRRKYVMALEMELRRNMNDPEQFLLRWMPRMSERYVKPYGEWRFLHFVKEELMAFHVRQTSLTGESSRLCLFKWRWYCPTKSAMYFVPNHRTGFPGKLEIEDGFLCVEWFSEECCRGRRDRVASDVERHLNKIESSLPQGVLRKGRGLYKKFPLKSALRRNTARKIAPEVYEFLRGTYPIYEQAGAYAHTFDLYEP